MAFQKDIKSVTGNIKIIMGTDDKGNDVLSNVKLPKISTVATPTTIDTFMKKVEAVLNHRVDSKQVEKKCGLVENNIQG